jgi:hypothetical protein
MLLENKGGGCRARSCGADFYMRLSEVQLELQVAVVTAIVPFPAVFPRQSSSL